MFSTQKCPLFLNQGQDDRGQLDRGPLSTCRVYKASESHLESEESKAKEEIKVRRQFFRDNNANAYNKKDLRSQPKVRKFEWEVISTDEQMFHGDFFFGDLTKQAFNSIKNVPLFILKAEIEQRGVFYANKTEIELHSVICMYWVFYANNFMAKI